RCDRSCRDEQGTDEDFQPRSHRIRKDKRRPAPRPGSLASEAAQSVQSSRGPPYARQRFRQERSQRSLTYRQSLSQLSLTHATSTPPQCAWQVRQHASETRTVVERLKHFGVRQCSFDSGTSGCCRFQRSPAPASDAAANASNNPVARARFMPPPPYPNGQGPIESRKPPSGKRAGAKPCINGN